MPTLDGTIVNGEIVLQSPCSLPEGSRVRIDAVASPTVDPRKALEQIVATAIERRRNFGGRTREQIDVDLAATREAAELEIQDAVQIHKAIAAMPKALPTSES